MLGLLRFSSDDEVTYIAHLSGSLAIYARKDLSWPQMAKLRKQPKSPSESPTSSKPKVRKIDSSGSSVLPAASQTLRDGTNHEQRRSDNAVQDKSQKREQTNVSRPDWTKPILPTSPWVRTEQPVVTKAQRRPSPLRISQEVAPVPETVVAGPSQPEPAFRRGKCGPSCQKCGRPRKPRSPDESNDEITRTPAGNWPLPGPGNEPMPSTSEDAPEKGVEPEGPLPEPAAVQSSDRRSKRRKYFSLPSKPKPSFKGPMDLASIKGKAVERPTYQEPGVEKVRPVSAPSPIESPKLQPSGAPHVHFATDDRLGRFAADIRAPVATSSSHVQVSMPSTTGPAPKIYNQDHEKRVSKPPTRKPHQAPQSHPQSLKAAQPTLRPNSPVFYEWPLITTLVNQPNSNSNQRHPIVTNAPARSTLSISKRPSRRNTRPYSDPHIHAPAPSRSTSHRRKSLLQQSRKVSYIVDHPATNSHDSISIQILDMLQGYPGGELAATAKTIPERPSLLRLQIYPLDTAIRTVAPSVGASDEEIDGDVYSQPKDASENDDDDDDDDDDDLSMPTTPSESPFSPASFSAGDDKALTLRPPSTTTHTSFSVGDDRIFNVRTYTNSELGLPSEPSTSDSERDTTAVSPPDPSPSREAASPQPLMLTPKPSPPAPVSRDSEGMIPVLRLSIDLPEVTPNGSENMDDDDDDDDDDIDPDWFSWGALPGSYGDAGMWSGSAGPAELEVPT